MLDPEQVSQVDSGTQVYSDTHAGSDTQAGSGTQVPRHHGSLLVLAGEHAPKVLVAWRSTVQHTQHIHLQFRFFMMMDLMSN